MTSAGAPVPPDVVATIRSLLPADAQFWTPYGATECLPVAVVEGVSWSVPARPPRPAHLRGQRGGPQRVRIIAIDDAPLADWSQARVLAVGEVGEITVAGPTATDSYFNRPQATAAAKIRETLADGSTRIVHRMGDVGYFDAQGRLWFCGRKTHRVETAQGPLYTEQVEPVFNTVPGVARTALVGVGPAGAQVPVLCVELQRGQSDSPALQEALRAHAAARTPEPACSTSWCIPRSPSISVTTPRSAAKLAVWASAELEKRA